MILVPEPWSCFSCFTQSLFGPVLIYLLPALPHVSPPQAFCWYSYSLLHQTLPGPKVCWVRTTHIQMSSYQQCHPMCLAFHKQCTLSVIRPGSLALAHTSADLSNLGDTGTTLFIDLYTKSAQYICFRHSTRNSFPSFQTSNFHWKHCFVFKFN